MTTTTAQDVLDRLDNTTTVIQNAQERLVREINEALEKYLKSQQQAWVKVVKSVPNMKPEDLRDNGGLLIVT